MNSSLIYAEGASLAIAGDTADYAAVKPLVAGQQSMQAAVYYRPGNIKITEVAMPSCQADEILVQVAYCGLCGTDLHEYFERTYYFPAPNQPHPISGKTVPLVIGHEFSGIVCKVGLNLEARFKVGQKVVCQPDFGCSTCNLCQTDRRTLCRKVGFVGCSGISGGFAQYCALAPENVHILPENIQLDVAALIEPLAVAWHAIKMAGVGAGDSVLVIGCGPVGCLLIHCLKVFGVRIIICAETSVGRQQIAKASGANIVVNPVEDDVVLACYEASDGQGVRFAFEVAGRGDGSTLNTAIASTCANGTIVNVAMHNAPVPIDMASMSMQERRLLSVIAYSQEDFSETIAAVADGRLQVEGLISARIALRDLVEHGFLELHNNRDKHLKILVEHSRP